MPSQSWIVRTEKLPATMQVKTTPTFVMQCIPTYPAMATSSGLILAYQLFSQPPQVYIIKKISPLVDPGPFPPPPPLLRASCLAPLVCFCCPNLTIPLSSYHRGWPNWVENAQATDQRYHIIVICSQCVFVFPVHFLSPEVPIVNDQPCLNNYIWVSCFDFCVF